MKDKRLIGGVFIGSIFLTIVSQLPFILENELNAYFQVFWFVPLALIILRGSLMFKSEIPQLFLIIVIVFLFGTLMELFTLKPYVTSEPRHVMNMIKSFFIIFIAFNCAPFLEINKLKFWLGIIGLLGGGILAVAIYQNSFSSNFDVTAITYAYSQKNSASQILLSCLIFSLYFIDNRNKLLLLLKIAFAVFGTYVLLIMKSRATILGIVLVIILFIRYNSSRRIRLYLLGFVFLSAGILFFNESIRSILIESIILGGRDLADPNSVSSGRYNYYLEFPSLFQENVWFGRGYYFSESFPLSILLSFGFFGAIPFFLFLSFPIVFFLKKLNLKSPMGLIFLVLLVTYYFNGLFEEQAPLGPGSKNFLLWLLYGYLLGKFYQQKSGNSLERKSALLRIDKNQTL